MGRQPAQRRPRNWPSIPGPPHRRGSRALARLEDITRLVSEWVWETDAKGNLTFVSNRATEILGLIPAQMIGRRMAELGTFVAAGGGDAEPDWNAPFRDVRLDMPGADGEARHFLVSGLPYHDPETWRLEGFCGITEDITQRLHAEEALRVALEKAEAASRAKSDFLSSMGHELHTPLSAIIGFAELLQRRAARGELDQKAASFIGYILDGAGHLSSLVEGVLEYSRSENPAFEPRRERLDVRSILDASLAMVSPDAETRGVSIADDTAEGPLPDLLGDAPMVRRILLNLLSNAIKYNREDGRVRIHATVPRAGFLALHVEDTGAGIEPDQLAAAFEPFNRLGREGGAIGGTGIGLALVKRMAEAMGGAVKVKSRPGHGSTFWIELPTAP